MGRRKRSTADWAFDQAVNIDRSFEWCNLFSLRPSPLGWELRDCLSGRHASEQLDRFEQAVNIDRYYRAFERDIEFF